MPETANGKNFGEPSDAISRPSAIPWPPILLVAAVLAAIVLERTYRLPWPGMDDLPARIVGLGIGVAGLVLFFWAMLTFRRHLTTIRPDKAADVLITDGPFRFRRNPIYLADVMILLGLAELNKNAWYIVAAMVFAILVTKLAILPEERHLEAKFGDAYRDYKSKTRRWI